MSLVSSPGIDLGSIWLRARLRQGFIDALENHVRDLFAMVCHHRVVIPRYRMYVHTALGDARPSKILIEASLLLIHDERNASRILFGTVAVQ